MFARMLTGMIVALSAGMLSAAPPAPIVAVTYTPDGARLIAASRDTVHVFDANQNTPQGELAGIPGRITALTVSRSGLMAIAAGQAGKTGIVRLYDLADLKKMPPQPSREWQAHNDAIYGLSFSPDGKTLATAGYDRTIKLWDLPVGSRPTPRLTLTDHSDTVYAVAFSPTGSLLASVSADRTLKIWDPKSGKRLYTLGDPTDWVYALAWSPDGKRVFAGGVDKSLRSWDVDEAGGKLVASVFAHDKAVLRIALPQSGSPVLTIGEDRSVKSWDPATLKDLKTILSLPTDLLGVAIRPDGKQYALAGFDGTLAVFDLAQAKQVAKLLPAPPKPPAVSKLSTDSGPRGQTIRLTVEGNHLDTVTEAMIEGQASPLKIVAEGRSATRLNLDWSIPAEATPGAVQLVLKSPIGNAPAQRLWIDRYPAVAEEGMTESTRQGMAISYPATVVGSLDRAGDTDYYRFPVKAGEEVGVQILIGIDRGRFDPLLELIDLSGRVVARGNDGTLGYRCTAAGTLALAIRDREYRGGADYTYRLHVGPFAVVTGIVPSGVQRGVESEVSLRGVNLPTATTRVKFRPDDKAAFNSKVPLPISRTAGDPVGRTEVTIGEFPSITVPETGTATLPTIPATADGVLIQPGQAQTIQFAAKKGERLILETHAARIGSPVDTTLEVLDSTGKPVPRVMLRCVAKTYVTFRDHTSESPGIRLETWNELAMDDYLYVGSELMRIKALPRNPDDDCQFYEVGGKRQGFLGTTPTHHAMNTPMYKVAMVPPGTSLPSNGMPTFTLYYRNDDGGAGYGKDSRVVFDPPADGTYQVRVRDASGTGGDAASYRLTVRPPRPDYTIAVSPTNPSMARGNGTSITVTATRIDDFEGPINIRFAPVTAPFQIPDTIIEAWQNSATVAISAREKPSSPVPPIQVQAAAMVGGQLTERTTTLGSPTVTEPGDLITRTAADQITIRPGTEIKFVVKIDRRNDLKGRVPLDVRGLPHGVRVLNVGLNGILVLPEQTEREIVLYAEPWVQPMERPIVVLSRSERKGTEHVAPSVMLKVLPTQP